MIYDSTTAEKYRRLMDMVICREEQLQYRFDELEEELTFHPGTFVEDGFQVEIHHVGYGGCVGALFEKRIIMTAKEINEFLL